MPVRFIQAGPAVCRDFFCYHILIHHKGGAISGGAMGKNTSGTGDAVFKKLWDETGR